MVDHPLEDNSRRLDFHMLRANNWFFALTNNSGWSSSITYNPAMKLDTLIFYVVELLILGVTVNALTYNYRVSHSHDNLTKAVTRGDRSWQMFISTWAILVVPVMAITSSYAPLATGGEAVTLSMLNFVILLYLCFASAWFKNEILGVWSKLKNLSENH